MHPDWSKLVLVALLILVLAAACAPGNARYRAEIGRPANFWAGLWHGLIVIVTFVVGLFTKDVGIYESNNVGWGYNAGFILGCMISLGGAARSAAHKRRRAEPDWDRIGRNIGDSVRQGLSSWHSAEQKEAADWDELGRKIDERIREELRKHRD